jgi:hypothetical protein
MPRVPGASRASTETRVHWRRVREKGLEPSSDDHTTSFEHILIDFMRVLVQRGLLELCSPSHDCGGNVVGGSRHVSKFTASIVGRPLTQISRPNALGPNAAGLCHRGTAYEGGSSSIPLERHSCVVFRRAQYGHIVR